MVDIARRRRIEAIVREAGPFAGGEEVPDVAALVDAVLEAPLPPLDEDARTDVLEALLHLGYHTGDE